MLANLKINILCILLSLFFIFCNSSNADGTWVNCNRISGQYYQYFNNTTIEVGKNSEVGDLLGTWYSSYNPTAWSCQQRPIYENTSVQFGVQGYPPYITHGSLYTDGATYTIYDTAVKPGLGYIVRWRFTVDGQVGEWMPLTIGTGGQQLHSQLVTVSYNNGNPYYVGLDVQIRFVKISTSLTGGVVTQFDPIYMRHYQAVEGLTSVGGGTYMIAAFIPGGLNISTTNGTCTTPDVIVNLPPATTSQFVGIGSTSARKDFNLRFHACPAGMASISYSFSPTTSILDLANGVVAANNSSTTSGIGIQLMQGDNSLTPIIYNTLYPLTDYDSSNQLGNYTLPMVAGLYQTNAAVTPGKIQSEITFTVDYK